MFKSLTNRFFTYKLKIFFFHPIQNYFQHQKLSFLRKL